LRSIHEIILKANYNNTTLHFVYVSILLCRANLGIALGNLTLESIHGKYIFVVAQSKVMIETILFSKWT